MGELMSMAQNRLDLYHYAKLMASDDIDFMNLKSKPLTDFYRDMDQGAPRIQLIRVYDFVVGK
jgi:hypothetical protein